jgi:hypothetical protein
MRRAATPDGPAQDIYAQKKGTGSRSSPAPPRDFYIWLMLRTYRANIGDALAQLILLIYDKISRIGRILSHISLLIPTMRTSVMKS